MITFRDLAAYLGYRLPNETVISGVSTSTAPAPNTFTFINSMEDVARVEVEAHPSTLFLVPAGAGLAHMKNCVELTNPRRAYALAVRYAFPSTETKGIARTAICAESAVVADDVTIGHYAVIEQGVVLGAGCVIGSHTVLHSGVRLGKRVSIGSHSSIGGSGFGFEVDETGSPLRIRHLGGVHVEDDVEIGSHVVIAQGTIEPTRVAAKAKIDDCVFIAHNVSIGEASFVIAGAQISGSVAIGRDVWISPEATVIQKVSIGDGALVGIGAVVTRDVQENTVVAGVPAKPRGLRRP